MSSIVVTTPPAIEPITLSEMKIALGYGPYEDSDHVLSSNIATRLRTLMVAAREYCEEYTARKFINTGMVQYLDSFPYYTDTVQSQQAYPPAYYSQPRYSTTLWNYSQMIKLFYSPLVAVDHITYIDSGTGRPKALTLGLMPWYPLAGYVVGATIQDSNGNVQQCVTAGETGATEPTWPTASGPETADGTVTWQSTGAVAPVSKFIVDNSAEPARIFPVAGQYWPSVLYVPNAVSIYHTVGYGAQAKAVPARVRAAIRTLVKIWDKDPSQMGKSNDQVDRLLASFMVYDMAQTRG